MRSFQRRGRKRLKRGTPAERLLERELKKRMKEGEFMKQYPIGPYIADFYFPWSRVVVEADGKQHYTEKGLEHDREREKYMRELGIKTMRFTNEEIRGNIEEVILEIVRTIESCKEGKIF